MSGEKERRSRLRQVGRRTNRCHRSKEITSREREVGEDEQVDVVEEKTVGNVRSYEKKNNKSLPAEQKKNESVSPH